jgi:Tol biopolymer transport system component
VTAREAPPLEALIEEARRRARRRRLGYLAAALAAAAGASALFALARGGGHATTARGTASHDVPPLASQTAVAAARASGGTVSTIGVPIGSPPTPDTRGDGWFGVSSIGAYGRLRHLIRCPRGRRWCGEIESIAWSGNGRWLALAATSYGAANPYNGINVIDLASATDTLIRRCQGRFECDWFDLDWSPDGQRLAYVTNGLIYLLRRSGEGGATLLRTELPGVLSSPSWSADGTQIVFAARAAKHLPAAVYAIRPDGTHRRLLADNASEPESSPRGTIVAVTSRCGGIKLITLEGRDVTPGRGPCRVIGVPGAPTWSPDGTELAIAATRGSRHSPAPGETFSPVYRRPGIYLVDADGSRLRLLTADTTARSVTGRPGLSWQPLFRARSVGSTRSSPPPAG